MKSKRSSTRSNRYFVCLKVLLITLLLSLAANPRAQAQNFTTLHRFTGGTDGTNPYAGLVMDVAGNLYGVTTNGGPFGPFGYGTVYKLDDLGNETVLYSFTGGADGSHPVAGLIMDAAGNLYGTTQSGGSFRRGTVFKVDPSGNETVLYSFTGGPDGSGPSAALAMDAAGNLYSTTSGGGPFGSGTVFKVDPSGNETVLYGFTGGADGLQPVAGLVMDAAGNLYGTTNAGGSFGYGAVFKVDPSGNETVLHCFNGGANGAYPYYGSLIIDAAGNLYGTTAYGGSFGNGTVFKVDPSGNETVVYSFMADADGANPHAGLIMDAAGNLYGTTDGGGFGRGTVLKVDILGNETVLYRFTGGADGAFPSAGLIMDAAGNLYGTTAFGGLFDYGIVFKLKIGFPTAVAGPNQTVRLGQTVHLDGSGSFAPDTLPANLQYTWTFASRPSGSTAVLTGANTTTPSFVADAPGDFVVQLIVADPATLLTSRPAQLTVSTLWSPPTANPGPAQSVMTGQVVDLNGTGSTDPNGLPLLFAWSFVVKPSGSAAAITPSGNGLASFTSDVAGSYSVGLVVSDFFGSSTPATVIISAITPTNSAQRRIQDAINYIAAMPSANFDAPGHRNALLNQLQHAIDDIQKSKIAQAMDTLSDSITRTNGFPLRGALDSNGPGMDWITDARDQAFVYSALTDALNALNFP